MLVVAATFVAEPLKSPLTCVLEEAGLQDNIVFAPYHQVFQQLLTPTSELGQNIAGTNIVLVRIEDFVRDQPDVALATQTVEQVTLDLCNALEKFASRVKGALILAVLPPGPLVPPALAPTLAGSNRALLRRAVGLPGIHILDELQINAVATSDPYDLISDQLAHIPYSEAHFAALALAICRRIHAISVSAAKVLVLDCDNTLWRGVVGEDGPDGIELSEPYLALQDFAIQQHAKGILVCLVSKNTEADVLSVLERRREMRLGVQHLVAYRVNWQSKCTNIRALAAELNLGLDAFVFLDDNPIECAQVHAELPQVITIQVPTESEIKGFLPHLWTFDKLTVTAEDVSRTQMYRENAARRAVESSAGDIGEFIAALDLRIEIAPPSEEEWPRVEQLTQRTNQFNFTTRRRSVLELKSIQANGAYIFRVRVADRFGDYGLVGVMVVEQSGTALLVDTLLLSCRVLGRGVEHAMLRRLGQLAESLQLDAVLLPYLATARNVPARAFADSVASEFSGPSVEGLLYRLPTAQAVRIEHRPGHDPSEVIEARIADEKRAAGAAPANTSGRSERYSRFALELVSGRALLEHMAARDRHRRSIAGQPAAPASRVEEQLLRLWQDVLGIEGLGVEDDFFALGGTSLLSVKLFAEIARQLGAQLSLTAILQAPTVRSLARLVASSGAEERSGVVCLRRGGSRKLFLVHDGLGETLLYLNLAKRLPPTLSVYGIEPKRLPGIPLAHMSIESMAAFYVGQIKQIQPRGPYLLGGMCAGGVIAYEMAVYLRGAGESVQMVTILDGATPQAVKRVGLVNRLRLTRLADAMDQARRTRSSRLHRGVAVFRAILRKVRGVVSYELTAATDWMSVRLRFVLMKHVVRRGQSWPAWLPELSVMQIYNLLEARYRPSVLVDVPVVLVRASRGDGTDTPYRELYQDEDLGWRSVARQIESVDVSGGHSSMLQEHAVESLASAMIERLSAISAADVTFGQ